MSRRKVYKKCKNRHTGQLQLTHRVLAAEYLGRPLLPGEVVHHRDGDSTNNVQDNLLVLPSQAHHAHIEHVLRRARAGQLPLFPELLNAVEQKPAGTLFDNVLPCSTH